ncbi:MAG: hypothetical protein PWP66_188 [Thermosediminibacterales bacterium]|nr:hypothetical protein [Thermosediminibacterales bacterium]
MDRERKIQEIISFVQSHKESFASKIVCHRILGDKNLEISEEIVNELRIKLPRAKQDDIDACYFIVK